jgi:hypothetical protein
MVACAVAFEDPLCQFDPMLARTSSQYFADASVPLVHDNPLTPLAIKL